MKNLFGVSLFVVSLVVGYVFFVNSFDSENQKRAMASLKNQYDLSCLSGSEFQQAVKQRIISGLKTSRKNGYLGFHLGHFTFADPKRDLTDFCRRYKDRGISSALQVVSEKLACREYPKVTLQFTADQEAVADSKRQLSVETSCEVSDDLSRTEVVWIPWEQLAQETPFEGDTQYSTPSKVSIRTTHIFDKWPRQWILERIVLSGASGQISVESEEIRTIAGRPLVFDFK